MQNAVTKASFNKKTHFTSKWDLNLRTKPVKCHIWSIAFCGAESGNTSGSGSEDTSDPLPEVEDGEDHLD